MKYVTTQDEIKQKKQYGMILNTDSNNNNGFQHFVMSNQFPTYIKDAISFIWIPLGFRDPIGGPLGQWIHKKLTYLKALSKKCTF